MKKKTIAVLTALAVAAVALFCGCGRSEPSAPADDAPPANETSVGDIADVDEETMPLPDGALEEGDAAPDFTVELAGGGSFTLSEHKDEVVLVNFWATWCPPCVGELPAFEQMKNDKIEGFAFVAVNCNEDKDTVDAFLAENGYTFNVGYDEDGSVGEKYPTDGIPYTLIIRNGTIEKTYLGAPQDAYEEYKGAVEEALSK